jgi:hypothetical protein
MYFSPASSFLVSIAKPAAPMLHFLPDWVSTRPWKLYVSYLSNAEEPTIRLVSL